MEKKISEIKPDPNQPRKTFDEDKLKFLAESILSNGLLKPIEIDENYIITDGERRWRAHKIANLKKIDCIIVKLKGDKKIKLKRQLISDLLDDKIPTEESYEAIVKLWKMEKDAKASLEMQDFCKEIGINRTTLQRALNYIKDKQADPEAVEGFSAGAWREVRNLPKEDREEIREELAKDIKEKIEPVAKIIEQKKKEIKEKKEKKKLEEELEETRKELSKKEIKITTDRERLFRMRDEIIETQRGLNRLKSDIRWMGKTKFYLKTPRDRDSFIRFIEGASDGAKRWASELDELREKISIEIIRE